MQRNDGSHNWKIVRPTEVQDPISSISSIPCAVIHKSMQISLCNTNITAVNVHCCSKQPVFLQSVHARVTQIWAEQSNLKALIWYSQENIDNFYLLNYNLCMCILAWFLLLFLVIKKLDVYLGHTFSTVLKLSKFSYITCLFNNTTDIS